MGNSELNNRFKKNRYYSETLLENAQATHQNYISLVARGCLWSNQFPSWLPKEILIWTNKKDTLLKSMMTRAWRCCFAILALNLLQLCKQSRVWDESGLSVGGLSSSRIKCWQLGADFNKHVQTRPYRVYFIVSQRKGCRLHVPLTPPIKRFVSELLKQQ